MSTFRQKLAAIFKPYDLPAETCVSMENEGLIFSEEKVRITVVYHMLKSSGRNIRHKRETVWGSLAISKERLVGHASVLALGTLPDSGNVAFKKKIIHLPFHSEEARSVKFSCVNQKVLVIAFDPALFNPKQGGGMEIRYHFFRALEAYMIIRDLIG